MTDRLVEKLRWFLERLDHPPMQLHIRDSVWVDMEDGAGSVLGSPALSHSWRNWLEGASRTVTVSETILCYHVGRPKGMLCEVCAIRDAEGEPIAESGLRKCEREVYRWPMLAAIAGLGGETLAPDLPDLATTLTTLARAGGDTTSTVDALARRWPKISDPVSAHGHFLFALDRIRAVWPRYDPA